MGKSLTPTAAPSSDTQSGNRNISRKEAEKNTIIAIQATMFSKVFPGKVLAKLVDNRTVLDFLITRIKEANLVSKIAIVTSDLDSDLPIVEEGIQIGCNYSDSNIRFGFRSTNCGRGQTFRR